jgi:Uma2 family endonuclease
MPALRVLSSPRPEMEISVPTRAKLPSMNVALRKPWTQEEFFAWAESQDTCYEFDGFQPVAMTGGFNNASAIGINLTTALRTRLRGSGCRPLGPDAGVETVNRAVRYPDALVTCTKFDAMAKTIPGVIVVFEVVGATTDSSRRDRITKVREYAAVPSIRRYVILESSGIGLTVMERSAPDQVWQTTVLTNDDLLQMPEIGIEIAVSEFYEDISFPDQDEASA